jgi:hypothetical protein
LLLVQEELKRLLNVVVLEHQVVDDVLAEITIWEELLNSALEIVGNLTKGEAIFPVLMYT